MPRVLVLLFCSGVLAAAQTAAPARTFKTVVHLETTAEESANASLGDLDADGDLDIVLAKGRHGPLRDRVLLNDGAGTFTASYGFAIGDVDRDGFADIALARSGGTNVLYLSSR